MAVPFAAAFVHPAHGGPQAPYFPLGGLFPRPEPDLFPVVDGPFVGRGFDISSPLRVRFSTSQLNVARHMKEIIAAAPIREEIGDTVAKLILWGARIGRKITPADLPRAPAQASPALTRSSPRSAGW